MKRSGFTLIELLVAISVIALLTSIAVASLNEARSKAQLAAIQQFAANAYHAAGDQAVGIWEMDECNGSTAADISGFGNDGTLSGGATFSPDTPTGKGCSVSASATAQFVNVGNGQAFSTITSRLTVMGWIKVLTPNCHNLIFSNDRDVTGAAYNGFSLGTYCGSQVTFRVWNNGSRTSLTGPTLQSNRWYHLAGVYDGSSLVLYIDGKQVGSAAYGGDIGTPPSFNGTIGGLGYCPGSCGHSLLIDSVRIYSKALVATEIERQYANSPGASLAVE